MIMSEKLLSYLQTADLAAPLPESEAQRAAAELDEITGKQVYPRSITAGRNALFFLAREGEQKGLGVLSADLELHRQFDGDVAEVYLGERPVTLAICETSPANAAALRAVLPFLVPVTLGLKKSAGCGD